MTMRIVATTPFQIASPVHRLMNGMANPMLAKKSGWSTYVCAPPRYLSNECSNPGVFPSRSSPSSRLPTTNGPSECVLGSALRNAPARNDPYNTDAPA